METIKDELKNMCQVEHSSHRSFGTFFNQYAFPGSIGMLLFLQQIFEITLSGHKNNINGTVFAIFYTREYCHVKVAED